MNGFGKEVPPAKKDVIVYFIQKGFTKEDALAFFRFQHGRDWITARNQPLVNWKVAAWWWIMKIIVYKSKM